MRTKEYFWAVLNIDDKRQILDLRTDQVDAIYQVIPARERGSWRIWREGLGSWLLLAEFPAQLGVLRSTPAQPMMPPPPPVNEEEPTALRFASQAMSEMPVGSVLEMDTGSQVDAHEKDRQSARYSVRMSVRIKTPTGPFECYTTDVSLGGMQLEVDLPMGLPRYFPLELKSGSEIIPVVCSILKTEDGSNNRLKIESNDFKEMLRTWLIRQSA